MIKDTDEENIKYALIGKTIKSAYFGLKGEIEFMDGSVLSWETFDANDYYSTEIEYTLLMPEHNGT